MNVAAFAVRRWQFVLVTFALLTFLGVNAFLTIPRAEDPHFPIPYVLVRAVLPGAEPAEMEILVVDPIEDALDGLDHVDKIISTARNGAALVRVDFDWSADAERKYDEVVREVNAIRGTLPQGASLEIDRPRTTDVAVVQVALVSETLPMRRLEKAAERLRRRLDRVPGVREAEYWGATPSEVRVAVDLGKLAALGLPVTAVSDALRGEGAETPVGAVHAGQRRFNVKTGGAFEDLQSVRDTPVASRGGQVVRVDDIAEVSWQTGEPQHLTSFNGRRAVLVTVKQRDHVDVGRLSATVERELDAFEKTLPGGVRLERGFFQARNVEHRLASLYRDFALALALVLITLTPLGLRAGVVVMLSIPLSLLIGLAALQALGFTLNQLSIAGFVLSLGLLVDDSIVVTENIARRMREGLNRTAAAIEGTNQITFAVLGCTATLMLAFLPLLALPAGAGAFILSLPVTVLVTVAASLLVSLTIIPFLASRILSRHDDPEGNRVLRAVMGAIQTVYRPLLHRALARPWLTLGLTLVLCATAVPMVRAIGTSLFPPAETPQFLVRINTPDGTALSRTEGALRFVEDELAATREIDWYASNLGRGGPQAFYNLTQHEAQASFAEVYVSLEAWRPRESEALLDDLRERFEGYPGAQISILTFENGPPLEAPIAVRLAGDDLAVLKALAARTEAIIRATPGTRDVGNPVRLNRTDLDLGIDEAKAAAMGVPAGMTLRIVRLALSGEDVARFRDANSDDYPVRVRLPMDERNELAALQRIYVPTVSGQAAPLGVLAEPALTSSPARIDRHNRQRTATVTAYVQTGYLTSGVTSDVLARLGRDLELPAGYSLTLGGQVEAQAESFAGLGLAVLIAIVGIFAVLVLEFRRFRTALVVAGIIPLGAFGAVAALALTGNSLSFTATIGLIVLIGIEIKNSILLVDFTEQLRREGVELMEAIEQAGEVRFLPVLLTAVTAIGGLMPLALEGSGLYSPLAIAIIGGLVSSTFLSRIATPVMYLVLARGPARKDAERKARYAECALAA